MIRLKNIALLLLFLLTGCVGSRTPPTPEVEKMPVWITRLPESNLYFYSVGISGPVFFKEDGVVRAGDNARVELGKTIASHIKDFTLVLESSNGEVIAREEWVLEILTASTDLVVENSEIVTAWVDTHGIGLSSVPGTTYALARMPKVLKIKDKAR